MGDQRPCLSAEEHHTNVSDYLLHYLGCLEFSEREAYYRGLSDDHRYQVDRELRRVEYLRATLLNDPYDKKFVTLLSNSIREWKGSEATKKGRQEVRQWRESKDPSRANGIEQREEKRGKANEDYQPDVDYNAYVIRYEDSQPQTQTTIPDLKGHFPNQKIPVSRLLLLDDHKRHSLWENTSQAGMIQYIHFPANNMLWVERAIARYFDNPNLDYDNVNQNPTDKNRTKTYMMLRPQFWKGQQHGGRSALVHARHLRPMCETVSSEPKIVEAIPKNIVLFLPYMHWETDRMREKLSQLIDTETEENRKGRRSREQQAKTARQVDRGGLTISRLGKKGSDVSKFWPNFTSKGDNQDIPGAERVHTHDPEAPARTTTSVLGKILGQHSKFRKMLQSRLFKTDNGRIIAFHPLGQVLFDAAMLYEAMSIYRDKMLIHKYLHEDPPLHPRRTLDQAYYWTLKTTKTRDRDQVVYRGTTVHEDHLHTINPKTKEWKCYEDDSLPRHEDAVSATPRNSQHQKNRHSGPLAIDPEAQRSGTKESQLRGLVTKMQHCLKRHDKETESLEAKVRKIGQRCNTCRDHIRKVSRVVMVDQLWMWILDEKTIITFFPRRYGVNKSDPSGVHKAIRKRLKALRKDHIKSVFDLGLIILDEVSNTVFDRTKTQDRQPQVMDIFSEAIGDVTNKHSIAFEHLWGWTEKLAKIANAKEIVDLNNFVVPLLNINPEGKLQREIKDIIDELDIMLHINRQQREVIKKYMKDVEHLIDPNGTWWKRPAAALNTASENESAEDRVKREHYQWFRISAEELLSDVDDRIEELEGLHKSAESTSTSLDHLLSLKQQQASVVQAWQSVKQAEEAVKQGRAIVIFTVITIIFLPLAFMSSIFGMNNEELTGSDSSGANNSTTSGSDTSGTDDNHWTLYGQLNLMFSVSIGIILATVILAYSTLLRTLIWLAYRYLSTIFLVKTGIYNMYLSTNWSTDRLIRNCEKKVHHMKEEVRRQKQRRVAQRLTSTKNAEEKKLDREKEKKKDKEKGKGKKPNGEARSSAVAPLMAPAGELARSRPTTGRPAALGGSHEPVELQTMASGANNGLRNIAQGHETGDPAGTDRAIP